MSEGTVIRFSKSELNSGKIMEAGWKLAKIVALYDEASSKGTDGFVADFEIISGKYEGVKVRSWYYADIGMGNLARVMSAAFDGLAIKEGTDYKASAAIDKILKVYTVPGVNPKNNNPVNQVNDYTSAKDENARVI